MDREIIKKKLVKDKIFAVLQELNEGKFDLEAEKIFQKELEKTPKKASLGQGRLFKRAMDWLYQTNNGARFRAIFALGYYLAMLWLAFSGSERAVAQFGEGASFLPGVGIYDGSGSVGDSFMIWLYAMLWMHGLVFVVCYGFSADQMDEAGVSFAHLMAIAAFLWLCCKYAAVALSTCDVGGILVFGIYCVPIGGLALFFGISGRN